MPTMREPGAVSAIPFKGLCFACRGNDPRCQADPMRDLHAQVETHVMERHFIGR